MTHDIKPWFKETVPGDINPFEDSATFFHYLAVLWNRTAYEFDPNQLKRKEGFDYVGEISKQFDIHPRYIEEKSDNYQRYWFVNNSTYLFLLLEKECVSTYVMSFDKEIVDKYKSFYKENTSSFVKEAKSPIHVISSTAAGIDLSYAGDALAFVKDHTLIEGNYTEDVVSSYKYIVEQFSKIQKTGEENSGPQGRIAILHGEPGSGKSYAIRSLVASLKNIGITIIVPPEMINSLGGPSLVSLLISKKEEGKPFFLVLEDADQCLTTRMEGNMSLISALLNVSDGILGGILDIRIVATCNSKITEFDPAIIRPGRLCEEIYVGPLPREKAVSVFNRLVSDGSKEFSPEKEKDSYTLAEVYEIAGMTKKSNKVVETKKKKRTLGFG